MTVQSRNKWGVIWRHFKIDDCCKQFFQSVLLSPRYLIAFILANVLPMN